MSNQDTQRRDPKLNPISEDLKLNHSDLSKTIADGNKDIVAALNRIRDRMNSDSKMNSATLTIVVERK